MSAAHEALRAPGALGGAGAAGRQRAPQQQGGAAGPGALRPARRARRLQVAICVNYMVHLRIPCV